MNKVVKNYLYNLSYQLLIIIVPLITTPYVSRILGANGLGTYSYTNSVVQYFILFGCIGINLYGQREIAYVEYNKYERDKTFQEIVILRIITVLLSLLLYYLTFATHGKYTQIYLIMSLDIIASAIDISWFFQGIEDFKKTVIRNFIIKLVGVFLIFLLVKTSDDLILYVLCHSLTLFIGNLSLWIYIPKIVDKVSFNELRIFKHLKSTITLFIPQIAISLYTVFDKTMIGLLTNDHAEVAYYEQGQKIIKIVLTIVTSLSTVMMPRIANLYQQNNSSKIKEYILLSIRFVFILAFPMMFGIMAISQNLVFWFFGEGYDKVILNMMLISPIIVFISFSGLFGTQYLLATGRQREYSISVISGTFSNFLLNLLLIPSFKSLGAAIATVIAEALVTLVQLYFVRKEFSLFEIMQGNEKYIISSIIMFIPIFILSKYLNSSIINTFLVICLGIVIYIFMLLIIIKDKFILNLIKKIKK